MVPWPFPRDPPPHINLTEDDDDELAATADTQDPSFWVYIVFFSHIM
jgi:hypothetical protein